jgi:tetratricopeptide (TPR) repeat protein
MAGLCTAQSVATDVSTQSTVERHGDDSGKSAAESRFESGLRLVEANKVDAAVELFSAMTRDYPRLPQPFVQLAALQARRGNLQAALTAMHSAIELQTQPAALQEQLGDLYLELASNAYRSAVEGGLATPAARTKYSTVQALQPGPAAQ